MGNTSNYKLSQYKEIRYLNDKKTVCLVYNIQKDMVCVKKIIDNTLKSIYDKLKNFKGSLLPEIYDIFEYEKSYIVIEEFIKGKNLEYAIKNEGVISRDRAISYLIDIANTLSLVHNIGIVHRDITPDNVVIDNNNRARLLDFDIARTAGKIKSTDTTILGTAGFASPEQFGFAQTDKRSDIYSLGVLLNYMVTGHIIQDKITDDSILKPVILKATKINPEDRFSNVNEMVNSL
ncbi:MAG: serine/threonine-protein kinase, partial [Lachnospirales bacterium]